MTKYLVDGNSYWRGRGEHLSTFYLYSDMFTSTAVYTQTVPPYVATTIPSLPWGGLSSANRITFSPGAGRLAYRNIIYTFRQVGTITPFSLNGVRFCHEFLVSEFPISELDNSTLLYTNNEVILILEDGRRIKRNRSSLTQINVAKGYELVKIEEAPIVTSQVTGHNYTHENVQYFADGMGILTIEKQDYLAQMPSEQMFTIKHSLVANNTTEVFSVYGENPQNQNPTCVELAIPVGTPNGSVESTFKNLVDSEITSVKDYRDPKWNLYQSNLVGDISPIVVSDNNTNSERDLAALEVIRGGEIKNRETRNRQDAPEISFIKKDDRVSYLQKFFSDSGYTIYSDKHQAEYTVQYTVTNTGTSDNPQIRILYEITRGGTLIYSREVYSAVWSDILSVNEYSYLWMNSFGGKKAQVEYENPFRVKEDSSGNLYVLYVDDSQGESLSLGIDKVFIREDGTVEDIRNFSVSIPKESVEADASASQLKYRKPYGKTIYEMLDSTSVQWNHYIHSADFAIINEETDEISIVFSLGINIDTNNSTLKTKYFMRRHCLYSEYIYAMSTSLSGMKGDVRQVYPYRGIHLNSDYQFSKIKITQKKDDLIMTVVDSSRELLGDNNSLFISGNKLRGNAIVLSSKNGLVWNRVYLVFHDDNKYAQTPQDALRGIPSMPKPVDKGDEVKALSDVIGRYIEGMRILDAESIMGEDGFLYVFYSRGDNLYCHRLAPYVMLRPPMWINPSTSYTRLTNFSTSVASTETFQNGLHTYSLYKPNLDMMHDSTGGVEYLPVIVDGLFRSYDAPMFGGTATYNDTTSWAPQYSGENGIELYSKQIRQVVAPFLILRASRRRNGVSISAHRLDLSKNISIIKSMKSYTYKESVVGSRGHEQLVYSGQGNYLEITNISEIGTPANRRVYRYANSELMKSRFAKLNVSRRYNGNKDWFGMVASLSDEIGESEFSDFDNGSTLFFRISLSAFARIGFQEVDVTADAAAKSRKVFFSQNGNYIQVTENGVGATPQFFFTDKTFSRVDFFIFATRNRESIQFDVFATIHDAFTAEIEEKYLFSYVSQGYQTRMSPDRKNPFVSPDGYPALNLMMGLGTYITVDNGIYDTLPPLVTGGYSQPIAEELFPGQLLEMSVGIDKQYKPVSSGKINFTGVEIYSNEQRAYYPDGFIVEFQGVSAKSGHKHYFVNESEGHISNALKTRDLRRWSGMDGVNATGYFNGDFYRETEITILKNYYIEQIDKMQFSHQDVDGLAILKTNILAGVIEYYADRAEDYVSMPFSAMRYELQGTGAPITDPRNLYGDSRLIYLPVLSEYQDLLGKNLVVVANGINHYRRIHDVITSEGIVYLGINDVERGKSFRDEIYSDITTILMYDDNIRIDFNKDFKKLISQSKGKFVLKNLYTIQNGKNVLALDPFASKIVFYKKIGLKCNLADGAEAIEMSVAEAQSLEGLADVDGRGLTTAYSLNYQIANEDEFYSTVELVNIMKMTAGSKELLLLKPKGVSRVVMNGEIQIEGENFNPLSRSRSAISKNASLGVIEYE